MLSSSSQLIISDEVTKVIISFGLEKGTITFPLGKGGRGIDFKTLTARNAKNTRRTQKSLSVLRVFFAFLAVNIFYASFLITNYINPSAHISTSWLMSVAELLNTALRQGGIRPAVFPLPSSVFRLPKTTTIPSCEKLYLYY